MNFEGEIREINLIERLVELWREQFTGAIRFENDGIIKIIYFKGGDVLSASTNDRADSVDEILMRAGKVSREHVKQALAKRKENETLGDALLNLGFITRKELTWARRVQVLGVIRSIDQWDAGAFTIVENYLPKREEGTIFPLPQIIVELTVTDQDREKYERALESGGVVYAKSDSFDPSFGQLGLNEDAEAIVKAIDGQRSAAEVAAASGQEPFNAFKLLHALALLGILRRAGAGPAAAPSISGDFAGEGVADASDAWETPAPKFELADEIPAVVPPITETPVVPQVERESKVPAWDAPPKGAAGVISSHGGSAADLSEEPKWGFDEAQIETAKRAAAPASFPPPRPIRRAPFQSPKPKRRVFPVVILALLLVGAAAYGAFYWWTNQKISNVTEARPGPTATQTKPPAAPLTPAAVTAAPVTSDTVASLTAPGTESSAPPSATPEPAPVRPIAATVPPSPAGSGGALRERYDAMAQEFASAASGNFTVQFEIVCEASNIQKALSVGGSEVWFVPISIKGRSCYRVFWGRYDSRAAAEQAAQRIPRALRETTPAVVTVPKP